MLCVIAKLDDAATKTLAAFRKIAYGEHRNGGSLYGHVTVATYVSDDEEGFICACKGYLNHFAAFDIIFDKIEVLDETSIIVASPRRTKALELLHRCITDHFNEALDQWTKSDAWYPHTTLYYEPEADLGKICRRMEEHFVPVTAHIDTIEFSRVLESGYEIVDHVNLSKLSEFSENSER